MRLVLTASSPSRTRFIGTQFPRGVWHVGAAGVGSFVGDGSGVTTSFKSFDHFLHSESEEWWVPWTNVTNWSASSVWWAWLPGNTVDITLFW